MEIGEDETSGGLVGAAEECGCRSVGEAWVVMQEQAGKLAASVAAHSGDGGADG